MTVLQSGDPQRLERVVHAAVRPAARHRHRQVDLVAGSLHGFNAIDDAVMPALGSQERLAAAAALSELRG